MDRLSGLVKILVISTFVGMSLLFVSMMFIKKKKTREIITNLGMILITIIPLIFMGTIVPVCFLSSIFKGIEGVLYVIVICAITYLIIDNFIQLRNWIIFKRNDIKEIYVRDVEVKYSPAVLSYLVNQKIENKKDLPATLLNLCSKNILKIEKNKDKSIKIVDLKNKKEVEKLSNDDKYAYEMFIKGVTTSKINEWRKKVEEEYNKYNFSKGHKWSFRNYMLLIYVVVFMFMFFGILLFRESNLISKIIEFIPQILFTLFFCAWEAAVIYGIREYMALFLKKETPKEFRDKYSRKGAKEYMKWKKFEKFIEEYTLVNEKEYTSIVLLGKYLSYSIALGINKKCDKEVYKRIKKQYEFDIELF